MPRQSNLPPPTLEEMRQAAPCLWVNCRNRECLQRSPLAITPLIIRRGANASSNRLRQNARRQRCGKRGADLQHPSARNSDITLAYHARVEDRGGISRYALPSIGRGLIDILQPNSLVVLAFTNVPERATSQRRVDSNQGVDARILCKGPMYLKEISSICLSALRIAFDHLGLKEPYKKAVRYAHAARSDESTSRDFRRCRWRNSHISE